MKRRDSSFTISPRPGGVQWIGFDLDMTMIRYKVEPLAKHIYQAAIRHMVEALSYPKWLLDVRPPSVFCYLRSPCLY